MPGSRDALLDKIQRWAHQDAEDASPIFWLSGIAGTGKSTISQTVCQHVADVPNPRASFFFSHHEGQRRIANLVFPTLIYQLLSDTDCPLPIKSRIFQSLEKNPSIGSQTLKTQFETLILEPLVTLSLPSPIVLVLDALDECMEEGVKEILNLIVSHLDKLPSFLKILVTSRPEGHIANILNPENLKTTPDGRRVFIHEIDPSADEAAVRAFFEVALSTAEVTRVFPRFTEWKLDEIKIGLLVKMTEGLFIVAATIVKFIMDSEDADPEYRLSVLLQSPEFKNQTHTAIHQLYIRILEHRYSATAGSQH